MNPKQTESALAEKAIAKRNLAIRMTEKVLKLRAEGLTFAEIGERLGIHQSCASKYFREGKRHGEEEIPSVQEQGRGSGVDEGEPAP